jgi:diguanylate cyclase (GGDEF)-like protein
MPLVAALLHWQSNLLGVNNLPQIPMPSLRINTASALTTFIDLLFLGIAWEILGKPRLRIGLWLRTYLTLLAVLMLDVVLFNTGAFLGDPNYLPIMRGTLVSRVAISIFSLPFLYGYLRWQAAKPGVSLENRPVLAILRKFTELEAELSLAQEEINRRRVVERRLEIALAELQTSQKKYRQLSEEFKLASITDALTGIGNRRLFDATFEKEWKRAVRERTMLTIMMIDIDGFKEYNDQYGHLAGDKALVQLTRELKKAFRRPADLLTRYGGDEFAVLLPRTDHDGAVTVAKHCLELVAQLELEGEQANGQVLTISIGLASKAPDLTHKPESLFEQADQALYQAKRSGGAQFAQAA